MRTTRYIYFTSNYLPSRADNIYEGTGNENRTINESNPDSVTDCSNFLVICAKNMTENDDVNTSTACGVSSIHMLYN